MNGSDHNTTPILIGFTLSNDILKVVKEMNDSLDHSKINFDHCIPHLTLWAGFVRTNQIGSLNIGLKRIFNNITIETSLNSLSKYNSHFGEVWSWNVQKNRPLYLLQNRVHHFFDPFREVVSDYASLNKQTINYINGFIAKSLDNYDPHITIGYGQISAITDIDSKLVLQDPKMFVVGNYCTCIRQIQ